MPIEPLFGIADPFSALSHLVGAVIALAMTGRLIRLGRGRPTARIGLAVFAISSVLLLATSGIYHTVEHGTALRVLLQRLDHAAIFVLIAGTFTPVHVILFRGPWRWGVLLAIWSVALVAIVGKSIFFEALPESVGLAVYLGMGWVGAGTGWILWRRFGFRFIRPAVVGGLAYTSGALIGVSGSPNPIPGIVGAHELFHCASLAGVLCFWRFMGAVVAAPPIGRPFARPPAAPVAGIAARDPGNVTY